MQKVGGRRRAWVLAGLVILVAAFVARLIIGLAGRDDVAGLTTPDLLLIALGLSAAAVWGVLWTVSSAARQTLTRIRILKPHAVVYPTTLSPNEAETIAELGGLLMNIRRPRTAVVAPATTSLTWWSGRWNPREVAKITSPLITYAVGSMEYGLGTYPMVIARIRKPGGEAVDLPLVLLREKGLFPAGLPLEDVKAVVSELNAVAQPPSVG